MIAKLNRKVFYSIMLVAGLLSVGHISTGMDDAFEISKNLSIFGKIYREINAFYVDDVDPAHVMRKGIDAMLESLDPYTNYISSGEIEDLRFLSTGSYGGIGASVNEREGHYIVTEAYEDDPAVKAGIMVGDEIIMIDNETIKGKKNVDIRNFLRGQAGTPVVLTISRTGEATPRKMNVMRQDVKIPNVPYYGMINDKVGYIVLAGFTQEAGKDVRDALSALKETNPKIEALILDLRNNPGGLLNEAVRVVSAFVRKGETVVYTKSRLEGGDKKYPTHDAPVDSTMRLAILVNGRAASASEIVAGAIQDLDRGIIVGTRSFGKGLVQTTRPLNYNAQLKLTTAKYLLPSERCIQAIDYSRRYTDGATSKMPDSLRKSFLTRAGRKVYDASGIEPEIEVKPEPLKAITNALNEQFLIFDFATEFVLKNPTIPSARQFKLSDDTYNSFVQYVKDKKFSYETPAERELVKLKAIAENDHNFSLIEKDFTNLQTTLWESKSHDFDIHKKEIADELTAEILKRYYHRKGSFESSFDNDPFILAALKILANSDSYKKKLAK